MPLITQNVITSFNDCDYRKLSYSALLKRINSFTYTAILPKELKYVIDDFNKLVTTSVPRNYGKKIPDRYIKEFDVCVAYKGNITPLIMIEIPQHEKSFSPFTRYLLNKRIPCVLDLSVEYIKASKDQYDQNDISLTSLIDTITLTQVFSEDGSKFERFFVMPESEETRRLYGLPTGLTFKRLFYALTGLKLSVYKVNVYNNTPLDLAEDASKLSAWIRKNPKDEYTALEYGLIGQATHYKAYELLRNL